MKKKGTISLIIVVVLIFTSIFLVLRHRHLCQSSNNYFDSHPQSCPSWFVDGKSSYQQTSPSQQPIDDAAQKDGQYFRDKYPDAKDQAQCLEEYYATYPENKPENQQPNTVYLPPPCPGIPQ